MNLSYGKDNIPQKTITSKDGMTIADKTTPQSNWGDSLDNVLELTF